MKSVCLNKIPGIIKELALGLLYPERCAFCDRTIWRHDGGVCPECSKLVKVIEEPRCGKCGKLLNSELDVLCRDCEKKQHVYNRGRILFPYESMVQEGLYRLKYGGRARYALYYGRLLAELIKNDPELMQAEALIPIPLHKKRLLKRGYNQAELIAEAIGTNTGKKILNNVIVREKNTKPMKLLGLNERQNNLKNAFKLNRYDVELKSAILIDDIYTTGCTVDEAARVLREAGVEKIYFMAVAAGAAM